MENDLSKYDELIEYWNNCDIWKSENDIPDLPIVPEEIYKNHIIPNVIRCGGIQKDRLKIGRTYIGSCRNSSKAIWDGKCFVYDRYKFGMIYKDTVNHFEDDDGYDLFIPFKEA